MNAEQRALVLSRDGGRCQLRLPGCTGVAEELDHIEARGMGGRHGIAKEWNDRPENTRGVCRSCHFTRHNGGRLR